MPKFAFDCQNCQLQFTKSLKMGLHPDFPCPNCDAPAPRLYEGFGFSFAANPTAPPGNTGVSKDDYPTADQAVGKSSEDRWKVYNDRQAVKDKVREQGQTHALIRRHGVEGATPYVEYEAGGKPLIDQRKKILKEIRSVAARPEPKKP